MRMRSFFVHQLIAIALSTLAMPPVGAGTELDLQPSEDIHWQATTDYQAHTFGLGAKPWLPVTSANFRSLYNPVIFGPVLDTAILGASAATTGGDGISWGIAAYGVPLRYGYGYPYSCLPGSLSVAALGASAAFQVGMPQTGVVTPVRVMQTMPSKASGNYYLPSTADPRASGGYYATTAPSAVPLVEQKKPVTNFWGNAGNPFSSDLNSVPWSK